MAKPKFRKGDLVRKCTESGIPIGPWLRIELANAYQVHVKIAEPIVTEDDDPTSMTLDKKHVWKPKIIQLAVSEDTIRRVKSGRREITHIVSPKWKELFDDCPDIVVLYTMLGGNKIYCVPDNVYYCIGQTQIIRLIIDRVICY